MVDNDNGSWRNQVVDGYSDAPEGEKNLPDAADRGWEGRRKPMSPEEEASLRNEAYDDEKESNDEEEDGDDDSGESQEV